MVEAIKQLREKLAARDDIEWHEDDDWLQILAGTPDGFTIEISKQGPPYMISYNTGWHERFDDGQEALECIAFGLSSQCRLRETRRGDTAYAWTVEQHHEDEWVEISTVGLLLFPFWRRKTVVYLQNRYIQEQADPPE